MSQIRIQLQQELQEIFRELYQVEVSPIFERPAHREHGDWSTNASLVMAKQLELNPRQLATTLQESLFARNLSIVKDVQIAGPGFINFYLHANWLPLVLQEVLQQGDTGYGRSFIGSGQHVNIEFVSANPTGPLHAGHGRNAAYGDALARCLEYAGYEVTREYYLNDRGIQMQLFAASLAARKAGNDVPDDGYKGQYIIDWAEEMPSDTDPLIWGEEKAIADHKKTLAQLRVHHDLWFSERRLVSTGAIEETLQALSLNNMVYESDGATWLRSTTFGDDKDRVLVKADGSYTYLLPDIAYHRDKLQRGYTHLINVWGADHHGYVARMHAALEALGYPKNRLEVRLTQLVSLQRDGQEVRLSKRTGEIVTLQEVLDEVGPDAARLTYLLQSIDTTQTFDIAVAASEVMENPVFYIQMAYARLRSIQRNAIEKSVVIEEFLNETFALLIHPREEALLRSLDEFPDVVMHAVQERAPQKISFWLRDFASAVHGFYHDCYVLGDDISSELTHARLALVEASQIGLKIGLELLGAHAPESM